jgi:hypothetical protein
MPEDDKRILGRILEEIESSKEERHQLTLNLANVNQKLDTITRELGGDHEFGRKGLIHRIERLEKQVVVPLDESRQFSLWKEFYYRHLQDRRKEINENTGTLRNVVYMVLAASAASAAILSWVLSGNGK